MRKLDLFDIDKLISDETSLVIFVFFTACYTVNFIVNITLPIQLCVNKLVFYSSPEQSRKLRYVWLEVRW